MREGEVFQAAYRQAEHIASMSGQKLTIHYGPFEWRKFIRNEQKAAQRHGAQGPYLSPAFDHEDNQTLSAHNCFSIIAHGHGGRVGAIAIRIYEEKLADLVEDGFLWIPTADIMKSDFRCGDLPDNCPLGYRVSQRGGLWVTPKWRHKGISIALQMAALSFCFMAWRENHEYTVGLRREDNDLWSKHIAELGEADIGTNGKMKFWLTWESRVEALRRFGYDERHDLNDIAAIV